MALEHDSRVNGNSHVLDALSDTPVSTHTEADACHELRDFRKPIVCVSAGLDFLRYNVSTTTSASKTTHAKAASKQIRPCLA